VREWKGLFALSAAPPASVATDTAAAAPLPTLTPPRSAGTD